MDWIRIFFYVKDVPLAVPSPRHNNNNNNSSNSTTPHSNPFPGRRGLLLDHLFFRYRIQLMFKEQKYIVSNKFYTHINLSESHISRKLLFP